MSKIKIQCFGNEAELISYTSDGEPILVIELDGDYSGYISMGNSGAKIKGKTCAIDVRRLDEGEYTPRLIQEDKTILLPRLVKRHGIISPAQPDIDYIIAVSLRARRLTARVEMLESELNEIKKKVVGTRLLELLP